ncbi:MAG: phosphatidylserine decarboxylase family protein [Tepidisphaeraceae bacterium]|jgi:phosphatidylserine decarboxylase
MLPLTRHGLREILIGTLLLAVLSLALAWLSRPLALLPLPIFIWLLAFFRDPNRPIPKDPGVYVSPADGTVSDITEIETEPLIGGPAIRVGIFLSVFNVHINRAPCDGKVLSVQYKKGKFVNAMSHSKASQDNESNTIVLTDALGEPVAVVKQIVGLIARRIICTAAPGDSLARGQRIGMIKFGSRTELTIPKSLSPTIQVQVGQKVRGAADVIATLPIFSGGAQHRVQLTKTHSPP